MWFKELLGKSWGKDFLGVLFLILIGTICYLWFKINDLNTDMQKVNDAHRAELISYMVDCQEQIKELNERHADFLLKANEELAALNKRINHVKKTMK